MKNYLPKRRIWRVAIYIVSTLLILLAIDLILVQLGRRIPHDYATTRVTEPMLADGRIDFLTVIEQHFGAGVTQENNAAPLIFEALGRKALPANQPPNGITNRLGMPPLPEAGDYFKSHLDDLPGFPKATGEDDPTVDIDPLMKQPWSATDHPRAAAWLAANEKPLAKIADATRRPRFFIPFNGGTPPELLGEILLPHLASLREASRALVCRAMLKAGSGDIAGAHGDLVMTHNLARLLGQGATLIDRLVSYAIDSVASDAEAALATDGKLDAAQAQQWLSASHELAPIASLSEPIDTGERYFVLDIMQYASVNGMQRVANFMAATGANAGLSTSVPWSLAPLRLAETMRVCNQFFDKLVVVAAMPGGPQRQEALVALEAEFDSHRQPNAWTVIVHPDWPLSVMVYRQKLFDRADATQAHRNLAAVSLALAIHKAEHGSYPPSLDALAIPDFVPPADIFGGKPLVYRRKADGYLLYSMGPNRFDDAGKGDDIAIRAGTASITTAATTKPDKP